MSALSATSGFDTVSALPAPSDLDALFEASVSVSALRSVGPFILCSAILFRFPLVSLIDCYIVIQVTNRCLPLTPNSNTCHSRMLLYRLPIFVCSCSVTLC